ncbi:hypothetical protein C5E06_09820 [Pseudoclavibacter sp. RFBI5]|uniref:DUF6378 domain-containing protein n=1 Tax=Pseudoclavibacter sp. RFBI5 TaxID=2080578 RepID=UPI000CE8A788|nr:DUF6378 domain-containing protein [Pseudoclavibacter sp. RFBI5]PPG02741.1 hypothetical protein C5E06_09820 [Pseudoclavibacter sp. RFBI5]
MSAGILTEALDTIAGPRQATYGSATDSFTDIGRHWEIILGVPVSAAQVAQAMMVLKLVCLGQSLTHRDSWVDVAGYSGLGAEAAFEEQEASACARWQVTSLERTRRSRRSSTATNPKPTRTATTTRTVASTSTRTPASSSPTYQVRALAAGRRTPELHSD